LRSPYFMYSTIIHMGSSRVHTPITRTMFGSFSMDMTFISRWKSDLKRTREIDGYYVENTMVMLYSMIHVDILR